MVLYITFIATLNLCVGYVLGVSIGVLPNLMPGRFTRGRDLVDEEPIGLKVAPTEVPKAEAPQAAAPKSVESKSVESKPSAPAPVAQPDPEQKSEPAPEPEATLADEPATPPDTNDILDSLSEFRASLARISQEVQTSDNDQESIHHCANNLKEVNDDYLEQANLAINSIDTAAGSSPSEEQLLLKQSLVQQSENVGESNAIIGTALSETDLIKAKEMLLASADQLSEATEKNQQSLAEESAQEAVTQETAAQETPEAPPAEGFSLQAARLVDIDYLTDTIDRLIDEYEGGEPLQMAAVVFNDDSSQVNEQEQADQLLSGLTQIVEEVLTDGQMAAVDKQGRLLVLLAGDDAAAATERCEQTRLQVSKSLKASVTCAVVDSSDARDHDLVLQRLDETLEEAATREGSSQTFRHDGKTVSPIVLKEEAEPAKA